MQTIQQKFKGGGHCLQLKLAKTMKSFYKGFFRRLINTNTKEDFFYNGNLCTRPEGLEPTTSPSIPLLWKEEAPFEQEPIKSTEKITP